MSEVGQAGGADSTVIGKDGYCRDVALADQLLHVVGIRVSAAPQGCLHHSRTLFTNEKRFDAFYVACQHLRNLGRPRIKASTTDQYDVPTDSAQVIGCKLADLHSTEADAPVPPHLVPHFSPTIRFSSSMEPSMKPPRLSVRPKRRIGIPPSSIRHHSLFLQGYLGFRASAL